jgi:hypothetical protein
MPFFFVPGNHDLANAFQDKLWKEKFGRAYYEFVYRDTLFLLLNSEDPPGTAGGSFSAEQIAWVKKTLADNPKVRWTMVFLHKPVWAMGSAEKSGWVEIEKLLLGRPYTVFAGHIHQYQKFVRQGQNYYMLATTGGDSKMRGVEYGEFDHLVWVTVKKDGPVLANVLLDGVLPEDLRRLDSPEEGSVHYNRKPTYRTRGVVLFKGVPAAGAYVVLYSEGKDSRSVRADGLAGADGTFQLSTYEANDGVPSGEYRVTVELRRPRFDASGKPGLNVLPAKYADAKTSPLKCAIKPGDNTLKLELAD